MKYLAICLLTWIPFLLSAQSYQYETGKLFYEEVVTAEGLTADQIYNKAKKWMGGYLTSDKSKITTDLPEEKQLISVSSVTTVALQNGIAVNLEYIYAIVIQAKDGRYRYTISDIKMGAVPVSGFNANNQIIAHAPIEPQMEALKELLQKDKIKSQDKLLLNIYKSYLDTLDLHMVKVIDALKKAVNEKSQDQW